jgi:23S rRNA (adenine2030-N6)-methyltransferase
MFSYRHAFHAGSHADVFKHLILQALLRYLTQKNKPLLAIDTHAGCGAYDLGSLQARTSQEAQEGIVRLWQVVSEWGVYVKEGQLHWPNKLVKIDKQGRPHEPHALLKTYLQSVLDENPSGLLKTYPGSPAWLMKHLRGLGTSHTPHRRTSKEPMDDVIDRLLLWEWQAQDAAFLRTWLRRQHTQDQGTPNPPTKNREGNGGVDINRGNGFEELSRHLPPRERRAFVLIDPSYEMKTDYAQVLGTMKQALTRFPVGVYMIWYPRIPLLAAHELPIRLMALARQMGQNYLHATFGIGRKPEQEVGAVGSNERVGLQESGVVVINPPYTLAPDLRRTLPLLLMALERGPGQGWQVESNCL